MVYKTMTWVITDKTYYFYFLWLCNPVWAMASSFTRFCDHTQWHATFGRTPSDEWSAHRTWQHTTHTTNIHTPNGIQTHDRSRQAAVDLCHRPRGNWDCQTKHIDGYNSFCQILRRMRACGCTCPYTETQDVCNTIDSYHEHMKVFTRTHIHS
jgi:hypothetical protein